ncbi:MAG: methyltransferase domain-containing protein [Sphingobium sp.]|nr:MAG: methyltransferase domain-containing protein [Sphingobium sp.]
MSSSSPGYQTQQSCVAIRGADDLQIRSLLDRQQYADPHGEAAASGFSAANWPLFGVLWPSSLQLAAHMLTRPLTPGERILEVGCGLALASLVCHRRGADVTASDAHPLALSFLAENVLLNDLMPLPYRHGDWAAHVHDDVHERHTVVQGRFNVIMGSDVLYERDEPGHLAGFIERHACPTAEVIIVDPNRGNRPAFTRRMSDQGFLLNDTPLRTPEADGLPYRGRLLRYSRAGAGT